MKRVENILLQLELDNDEPPDIFTIDSGLRLEPMRYYPARPFSWLLSVSISCDGRTRFAPPADKKHLRVLVFVIRVGSRFSKHLQAVPETVGLGWWQRRHEAVEAEEILWCEAKDDIAILDLLF